MNTSPEMINEAYRVLGETRADLLTAAMELVAAKEELKSAETNALLDGLEGKNAEQRKANLRKQTEVQLVTVEAAELNISSERYDFERALSGVELVKMLMRYDELAASK